MAARHIGPGAAGGCVGERAASAVAALLRAYNPLQKLAYTTAIGLGVLLAGTGLALYKPVQLSGLIAALGGFRLTRIWHFSTMCGLMAFIPGHLLMVAVHGWSNFASMWTGSTRDDAPRSCRDHAKTDVSIGPVT